MENMYIENMMEQFNSGELKKIFRNVSPIALIGLTVGGKYAWQEEETRKKPQYCTDASGTIVVSPSSSRTFRT